MATKRKFSPIGAGDHRLADVYSDDDLAPRRTIHLRKKQRDSASPGWWPVPVPRMPPLLDFFVQHEEAFKGYKRLSSLYSDFSSQRSTNPDGFNANVNAWKKALSDAARAGLIPKQGDSRDLINICTGDELAQALQDPRLGKPTCLPVVFNDAVAKREFVPLKDFLTSTTSIYKTSWIPSPFSILQWGLRQAGVLGQPGFSNKLNTGDFVVLSNLEPAATDILEQISTVPFTVDRIMSKTEFLKRFGKVLNSETSLSATDLDILLVHLARDKQAISYNKHTIKFKSPTDPEPSPITQDDISIAGLRDQIANLRAQSESITQKVAAADAEVRDAITKKQHARAKAALRSKKLAESALQHRTDVALQLEGLYAQLEQAADMVGVVAAMKAGGTALKSLNQELGGAEGVAEVVDAVREEMAKTDEITDIINESSQPIDELEIDDELEALERAEKEKKEQQEKAAREKREQEAAAKTAARLQELEQLEKERKEKDQLEDQKPEEQKQESSQSTSPVQQLANGNLNTSFSQMSFEEKSQADTEEEAERVPMAA